MTCGPSWPVFSGRRTKGSAEHAAIAVFLFGAFRLFSGDFAKRFMTHADDFAFPVTSQGASRGSAGTPHSRGGGPVLARTSNRAVFC